MFRLSHRFLFSTLAIAALTMGCGDDDGGGGNPDAGDNGGADAPTSTCPNHPAVTDMGDVCAIVGPDTAPITQDLTLTADNDYLLSGPVFIGDDSAETVLTIEPGVTIFGGDGSFLLIQRGSKIMAEGTAAAPIVLTSAKAAGSRGPEDWGGLVINGNAPINNGGDPDCGANSAPGEAGTGCYGGTDAADDSGVLKYVRVEFAGNKVDAENELNGIAFQGVGSGTEVDYVQTHMTSDDGIEFFGGTVSVKHVVLTGADDDSLDWTGGWSGKAQFVVAEQLADSGAGAERGIEADNLEANNSATPFSDPVLSHVTLIARAGNDAEGMRLRRGTKGEFHNFIVTGFGGYCIRVTESQTETNVTNGDLVVANMILNCTSGAAETGAAADMVEGESTATDPMLDGWMPMNGSPALSGGESPAGDSWFDAATYIGAFDGTSNWADGWTTSATN
jgi:hypothetical protein